jgi:hypothetical protein
MKKMKLPGATLAPASSSSTMLSGIIPLFHPTANRSVGICREQVFIIFSWIKTVGGLRRTCHKGLAKLSGQAVLAFAAYNLRLAAQSDLNRRTSPMRPDCRLFSGGVDQGFVVVDQRQIQLSQLRQIELHRTPGIFARAFRAWPDVLRFKARAPGMRQPFGEESPLQLRAQSQHQVGFERPGKLRCFRGVRLLPRPGQARLRRGKENHACLKIG